MTESNLMVKAVFWDMDGTLIDSEPYWHEGEMKIAAAHGGYWDEELAWQGSGYAGSGCGSPYGGAWLPAVDRGDWPRHDRLCSPEGIRVHSMD